ncbi:hypothetical protein, partial [Pannonibacter phragmitetus]|uniref:hypothetical protein n=1 Tax=Pannonibacter phragmitetus TaxID=121719 RepID=UPI00197D50B4
QPQADQFPALSGRHGDRQSYTTHWDAIGLGPLSMGQSERKRILEVALLPVAWMIQLFFAQRFHLVLKKRDPAIHVRNDIKLNVIGSGDCLTPFLCPCA